MWTKFLYLDPNLYNCYSFIEEVLGYKLPDEFTETYDRLKSKWGTEVSLSNIDTLAKANGFKTISIKELLPYDILVFGVTDTRPMHFGVYIGNNQFIHLRKRPKIDDFNQEWRDKLHFIYRR